VLPLDHLERDARIAEYVFHEFWLPLPSPYFA
jgi:hypothetical protein